MSDSSRPFTLIERNIHIWRAHFVETDKEKIAYCKQYLSRDELSQAKRFIKKVDQEKYIFVRAILRDIISRYIDLKPTEIKFQLGKHGKPFLDYKHALQFNLSHAKNYLLVALTKTQQIGIDIEYEKNSIDTLALAKRFFSAREFQALHHLSEPERTRAFYRCWTCKEAFIKAEGSGLSFPLKDFSINVDKAVFSQENVLLTIDRSDLSALNWHVQSVVFPDDDFPSKYYAALAVQGETSEIVYWDWHTFFKKSSCCY